MRIPDSKGGTNHIVPFSNGALRPPHVKRIGPALALFLKFEDMVTKGVGSDGLVSGGKPVLDADVAKSLGLHPNTVARHRARLSEHGYIDLTRTPNGYTVRVRKSKKWALIRARLSYENSAPSDPPGVADQAKSDPPKTVSDPPRMVSDPRGLVDARSDVVVTLQDVEAAARECWKAIGTELPLGRPRFQRIWEFFFSHKNGEPLSEAMERCIQRAQAAQVSVPRPFYEAKRAVEKREQPPDAQVPRPVSTEASDEEVEAMGVRR